jgi:hypothetical protein
MIPKSGHRPSIGELYLVVGLTRSTKTPVRVSHQLFVEVVYAVWGQDQAGRILPVSGPGEQRTVSVARGLILPHVSLGA